MQVVPNVKRSFMTTGSGHNRGGGCFIQVATSIGSTVLSFSGWKWGGGGGLPPAPLRSAPVFT